MVSVTIAELGERALRRLGVAVISVADRPPLDTLFHTSTLATLALIELGVIAADEDPAPLDAALALSRVAAVHDALVTQGAVSWGVDAVPRAVSEEYVKLAANIMASAFGKQAGDIQMHAMLEARVRKVAQVMNAPNEATAAVLSVHQDFAMRGKVRWSVFDIPPAVEDVYTLAAAYQLAPLFGMKPSQEDLVTAEHALARYIALPTSGERVTAEYF